MSPCSSNALVRAKTLRTSSSTISTVAPASAVAAGVDAPCGTAQRRGPDSDPAIDPDRDPDSETDVEARDPAVAVVGSSSGTSSVNTDPSPTVEVTSMRPPSMRASSLEIDSPSPVPPYLRLVVPSACWNASKIISSLPAGMPMPVSRTANASRPSAAPDLQA